MKIDEAGTFDSASQLDNLKKPRKGRQYWRDSLTPGLYFVISATGRRAWQTPLEDEEKWLTLGLYGEGGLALKQARKEISKPHARESGLKRLGPVLKQLRNMQVISEVKPGVYRCRSKPFLHFHHLTAHVRLDSPKFQATHRTGWFELDVSTTDAQATLVQAIKRHVFEEESKT